MSLITDLVTKYKSERLEAKLGQQLYAIPQKANDMINGQAFYYYIGDRRRTAVDFKKEICLHLNWLKFKKVTPKQYAKLQDSMTPMEDLIAADYIYPFLLFINGRMIRWEYITIVATQERYDLLVRGMDQSIFDSYFKGAIKSAYVIMLPDSIEYKDGSFTISEKTMFAFDEEGLLVKEGTARTVIDNYDGSVSIINVDATDTPIFVFSEENQYSYFSENICVFNNNLYDGKNQVSVLSSVVKVNNGNLGASDDLHVKIFFNKKMATPSYENISHVKLDAIKNDVIKTLTGTSTYPYLELLKQNFNVSMDRNKSYEENREESLDKIAKYNPLFFNEYYMTQKEFITIEVDYTWLLDHLDEDGALCIPRRFEDCVDYYLLILVNGELYKYYKNHKYKAGWFICPITGIEDGDKIEIWYFKNARNYELPAVIDENEEYLPLDYENYYINENMKIFSKIPSSDAAYEFPSDGLQHFPVDYYFEYNEDRTGFRIRYNDPKYYGKNVTLVSCNRFKYWTYDVQPIDEQDDITYYEIDLGNKFMYCNEYDRYLVFYNGRRLMNDHYRLVIPCRDTTPFTSFHLYLTIPMNVGDQIDIFYLPHHFNDIYEATEDLNATGLITVDKSKLPFALDKHLFTFWLNGKKIPASDIANFDANRVQIINDQHTLKTLRVTSMITDKDEYNELKDRFQTYDTIWDQVIRAHPNPYKLLGIPDVTLTNTEPDFFGDTVETNIIMRELLRDQYAGNPVVDITAPFVYDYNDIDQSAIVGTDSGGNLLLDIADANISNNLDVERPEV